MKALVLCLLVGVVSLPCMAAETFVDAVNVNQGIWDFNYSESYDRLTASWQHSVPGEAIGNISSASLTINVWGLQQIDPFFNPADDHVSIYLNGTYLGDLTGLETEFNSTSVPALIGALDVTNPIASASIQFQWESTYGIPLDFVDGAWIVKSTLKGEYMSAVPTPSAILLAGLGTTLVGFLRKRK